MGVCGGVGVGVGWGVKAAPVKCAAIFTQERSEITKCRSLVQSNSDTRYPALLLPLPPTRNYHFTYKQNNNTNKQSHSLASNPQVNPLKIVFCVRQKHAIKRMSSTSQSRDTHDRNIGLNRCDQRDVNV